MMRKRLFLLILVLLALNLWHVTPAHGSSRFGNLVNVLQNEIRSRRMGVYVIPLDNPQNAFGINEDVQVPSASAWKGGGIIYFFEHADPAMLNSMPIEFWEHTIPLRVPTTYRQAVIKYGHILYNAYIMTVFSGNHEAGNILAYVYKLLPNPKPATPIVAFNDWSLSIGMTPESGMRSWMAGETWASGYSDHRYDHRQFFPGDKVPLYDQTYSARDFAQFYYPFATVDKSKSYYNQLVQLLAIRRVRNKVISLIGGCPDVALSSGIITAIKDGYFRPDSGPDAHGHDVYNDAGLIIFPDGMTYVVAFTAFDAKDVSRDVTCKTIHAIVQDHAVLASF